MSKVGRIQGSLAEDFDRFELSDDSEKQAAQPIQGSKHPNASRYTNPSYNFSQTTAPSEQNSLLSNNVHWQEDSSSEDESKQQVSAEQKRARLARQRGGFGDQKKNWSKRKQPHKKWGNMVVLSDSKGITLGPDYLCFLPTFICFTVAGLSIIWLVFTSSSSIVARLSSLVVCLGQIVAYLLMAISNPGVAMEQTDDKEFNMEEYMNPDKTNQERFCASCGFSVPKRSYHCRDCDLCIIDYDHHCPWTGKCIGGNNLGRFYTFLVMTPLFLIYVAVAFIIVMSDEAHQHNRKHIRKLFECLEV